VELVEDETWGCCLGERPLELSDVCSLDFEDVSTFFFGMTNFVTFLGDGAFSAYFFFRAPYGKSTSSILLLE